ncbi:MAG: hypothetical protein IJB75_00705 [Oscillospiraceae bacterium]|nr:hypothetical protein [Oscillospiraceae bacterium]MBQ7088138.1 hypothetical protein [Clostridia bacterium]
MKRGRRIWITVLAIAAAFVFFAVILNSLDVEILLVKTDVGVRVNDADVDAGYLHGNPEAFIYNGTAYVAANAVGNAFGEKVSWVSDERMVYIGEHRAKETMQAENVAISFDAKSITNDLNVDVYRFKDIHTGSVFLFFVIENQSDHNLRINADLRFYNKNGALIGVSGGTACAVEKKTKQVIDVYLGYSEENYASAECVLSVEEETSYCCLTTQLTYETDWTKYIEVVSVTNNSDITAEDVDGHLFFFKKGKLIDVAVASFFDDDYELKSGQTVTRELSRRKDYDAVEIIITGYGYAITEEGNG